MLLLRIIRKNLKRNVVVKAHATSNTSHTRKNYTQKISIFSRETRQNFTVVFSSIANIVSFDSDLILDIPLAFPFDTGSNLLKSIIFAKQNQLFLHRLVAPIASFSSSKRTLSRTFLSSSVGVFLITRKIYAKK